MIEFEPIEVRGAVLRRHWIVTFVREGKLYSFADSKRPGYIAAPYGSLASLTADYEAFRGRKIVATKQMDTFGKRGLARRRTPRIRCHAMWGMVRQLATPSRPFLPVNEMR